MTRGCLLLAISTSRSWPIRPSDTTVPLALREHARETTSSGEEDLMVQVRQVQLRTGGQETLLCLYCNIFPCRYPCTRCLCHVVHLGDVAPGPFLVEELLAGKEPVDNEVQ